MKFLHYEFQLKKSDVVEVTLDKKANVQLLDEVNFNNYKKGKKYSHMEGLSQKLTIDLAPPYKGYWHLVVDLNGEEGAVTASVLVRKGQER